MDKNYDLTAHTIKVLLVDDQPLIAEKLKQMLSTEYDIKFYYCQEPTKAVKMANWVYPTIILQDLVMPDIEGLTLVRYFRANPTTREVPLIVLSSKEEPKTKAEAFTQGANDYMVKFPDSLEVIARIRYHSNSYINLLQKNEAYQKLSVLVEQEKERNRTLSLINKMNQQLQACSQEHETYKVIQGLFRRLLPNSSGFLGVIKKDGKWVQVTSSWGDRLIEEQEFPFEDCLGLRKSAAHLLEPNTLSNQCAHMSKDVDTGSGFICAPLIAQGENLGLIHLSFPSLGKYSDEEAQDYLEEKQNTVTRVSEYFAMTLANMRLREKLRLESIHDSLTGLYNRRYMDKCLQTEISRSKRHNFNFGVLLFDIDHFKNLNDTYGHEAGDVVLRKLSDYLQQNVRSEDVLCRYGGEEFLIILPDISKNDLQKISERIQKEIKKNIQVEYENHKLCITVSVGAANFPDNGQAATELLKAADEALYRAKDQGRDQVCIASGLDI